MILMLFRNSQLNKNHSFFLHETSFDAPFFNCPFNMIDRLVLECSLFMTVRESSDVSKTNDTVKIKLLDF